MAKPRREGVGTTRPVVDDHLKAWVEAMGGTMFVAPRVIAAFMRLRDAWSASLSQKIDEQASWDPWGSAVSLGVLRDDYCLTDAEIRWLADRGLVEARLETTRRGRRGAKRSKAPSRDRGARRTFRKAAVLTFAPSTCLILTQAGIELCAQLQNDFTKGKLRSATVVVDGKAKTEPAEKPDWRAAEGKWTVSEALVKDIAPQAHTQRAFLDAAQDVDWEQPVPNPYAHMPPRERELYLRRELSLLNKRQGPRRVHLRSRDKGRSFTWKIIV